MFKIPSEVIWGLESYNSSVIGFVTGNYDVDLVKSDFISIFEEEWNKAYDAMIDELDIKPEDNGDYYPLTVGESFPVRFFDRLDDLLVLQLEPLYIPYCYGEYCEVNLACEALDTALNRIKEKYAELEYDGVVAFPWSDSRCGEVVNYGVSTDSSLGYGRKLFMQVINNAVLQKDLNGDDLEFPELLSDELQDEFDCCEPDDFDEIYKFIVDNKDYLSKESVDCIATACLKSIDEDARDELGKFRELVSG